MEPTTIRPSAHLGVLGALALIASACVAEPQPEVEQDRPNEEDSVGTPASSTDGGGRYPCSQDLEIGPDRELLQEPVFCDPFADRIPDGDRVRDPYRHQLERRYGQVSAPL